jgi:carbon storage regulator CsrA
MGVRGKHVRIGIDAPRDAEVHPEEIAEKIKTEGDARAIQEMRQKL